jgi:hypothetical protein
MAELKGERQVIAMPEARRRRFSGWTRWAVAAGVALAALYLGRDRIDSALAPSGPRATVVSVSGNVYTLPQNALAAGAAVQEGDVVRTAADARAILQLADGSRVEMNQRTELAVSAAWSGQTIRLDRGDVIVEAARQRRGRLRVVTRDSIASVKGTVFAVSSGSAGSVVSVVEGSVAVSQPGAERLLSQGQRAATNPALDRVDVRQAVSWSQDAAKYNAVLAALVDIEKNIAEPPGAALRTEARLARYLPAGAQIYFAVPNLDGAIRQALFEFESRTAQNALLREWWTSDEGQELKRTLNRLEAITPLLGEEVVFVLSQDPARPRDSIPLVLASVQAGRQDALRQALDRIGREDAEILPYRFAQDLLLVSDSAEHSAAMAGRLGTGAASPFAAEIAQRYQRGVGWLAGIDMTSLPADLRESPEGRVLGIGNMRYLFFEQRWGRGDDGNEATLSFQGARTGMASWLASPGSAGSAEYISSDAVLAFSASTRDPRLAFEELRGDLAKEIREFEAETGLNISLDIAAALGTDFAFAVERPTLPIPGWIVAKEVVRPAVFDDTARRVVDAINNHLKPGEENRRLTLNQEIVNGRTWMTLGWSGLALYWTYDRGYLVASMDRALAARAIAVRESGTSLVRSAAYLGRFPATGGLHHSGFLWINTGGALRDLAFLIQNPALQQVMTSREPILIVVDGEMERIRAASRTRLTSMLLDLVLVHAPRPGEPGKL